MFRKVVFSEASFRFLTVNGSHFTASGRCIVMCRNSILYGRLRIVFYDLGNGYRSDMLSILHLITHILLFLMPCILLPLAAFMRTCLKIRQETQLHAIDVNYTERFTHSIFFGLTIIGTIINVVLFMPLLNTPWVWLLSIFIAMITEIFTVLIMKKIYPKAHDRQQFAKRLLKTIFSHFF